METSKLIRWTGLANIIAGVFTALFWFIHPDPKLTDIAARLTGRWHLAYGLFILVLILTLFGLIGIFAKLKEKTRGLGFLGFILGFVGTAIFVGAGTIDGFVSPTLAALPNAGVLLDPKGPLFSALAPLFIAGGLSFALGFVLLGISILWTGVLPKWAGLLFIISSPVLGLSPLMPAMARTAGSVIFGLAMIWIGYALWSKKEVLA